MNLSKLFETQRILDEHIMDEHPELKGQENLDWKILALQVELGECANEWRGFKKWSNDQEPRTKLFTWIDGLGKVMKSTLDLRFINNNVPSNFNAFREVNPLLEEYVDCLHFILSIGLELNFTDLCINHSTVKHLPVQDDAMINFSTVFSFVEKLKRLKTFLWYDSLFERFIVLGFSLGFTWEQIEQAYYGKNAINHERQDSGY